MSKKIIEGNLEEQQGDVCTYNRRKLSLKQDGTNLIFFVYDRYGNLVKDETICIPKKEYSDHRILKFYTSNYAGKEETMHYIFIVLSKTFNENKHYLHLIDYVEITHTYHDTHDTYTDDLYECNHNEYPINGQVYAMDKNTIGYFDENNNPHIIRMGVGVKNVTPIIGRSHKKKSFSIQHIDLMDINFWKGFDLVSINFTEDSNLNIGLVHKDVGSIFLQCKVSSWKENDFTLSLEVSTINILSTDPLLKSKLLEILNEKLIHNEDGIVLEKIGSIILECIALSSKDMPGPFKGK